ncbi:MAG: YraN family protein [Actinomycetales bacterium]
MAITPAPSSVGKSGEEYVAKALQARGYRILARNWRIREGEIDIVAENPNGAIVFVEVKSRTSVSFGDPLEGINSDKLLRIQRLALAWLATNQRLGSNYQIDVAGVLISRSGDFSLDYREQIL